MERNDIDAVLGFGGPVMAQSGPAPAAAVHIDPGDVVLAFVGVVGNLADELGDPVRRPDAEIPLGGNVFLFRPFVVGAFLVRHPADGDQPGRAIRVVLVNPHHRLGELERAALAADFGGSGGGLGQPGFQYRCHHTTNGVLNGSAYQRGNSNSARAPSGLVTFCTRTTHPSVGSGLPAPARMGYSKSWPRQRLPTGASLSAIRVSVSGRVSTCRF